MAYEIGQDVTKFITFDIETIGLPLEFQERMMPEFEEPKSGRARSAEDKKSEWLEKAALNAERARVALIGAIDTDSKEVWFMDDDESKLITGWWKFVDDADQWKRFAGHNILGFDLPFLRRRSFVLGVKQPSWLMSGYGGRFSDRFFDTMKEWTCGQYQCYISLDVLSKAFGGNGKVGRGSDFGKLWSEDREKAISYAHNDLVITKEIAEQMMTW